MKPRFNTRSAVEMHRAWLALVDADGPFLAVPPLKRVYPQGIPPLSDGARTALRSAKPGFDKAWDAFDMHREDEQALAAYRTARDRWVEAVARSVLGWGELYVPGGSARFSASSNDRRVTAAPTGSLNGPDGEPGALLLVVDPVDSLRDAPGDGWAAAPIDRMQAMLVSPGSSCSIGVVTDGRWWSVVSAPKGSMAASGVFDAQTWIEEPATRDAFIELLSLRRLVGGKAEDRLPALFAESVLAAEEITEALGIQVRRAVELVVSAFSEASAEAKRRGEADPLPSDGDQLYAAVVTVMMRMVFLLFAQERRLLPEGQLFEQGYGLASVLDALEERARDEGEEAMDGTNLTWHRLLATSQALYQGANFENMRLPAYGGSLFDPARFPFLTALNERGLLRLSVSDRVMLHALRAIQVANPKGQDARRISFRDIDVEQIGYIYEGLLGYTCRRADQIIVGLPGSSGEEPEVPLTVLEDLATSHRSDAKLATAIIAWAKQHQPSAKPPTKAALTKILAARHDAHEAERAVLAVTRDESVRAQIRGWVNVARRDLRGKPTVVLDGGVFVVETPSRKNAGAHYTPRALAEEVVTHALEPLVYRPGPHQTSNRSAWRRVSSDDILALRVADIACGSGAFLVAAARFLARELVEALRAEGEGSHSDPAALLTQATRSVVAQCLYGADINEMAVEMCKLSLWLVSLDKQLPFSFVDDKVLHGNSLLGVTDLRQIEALHCTPSERAAQDGLFATMHDSHVPDFLDLGGVIARVKRKRGQLASEVSEEAIGRTTKAKKRLLAEIEEDLAQLTLIADGVIAAGLALGGKPGKALDQAYDRLQGAVNAAFPESGEADPQPLDEIIAQGLTPTVETDYERWLPLHWALELPDVMEHGGFDAIIGNPPFLGGKKISPAMGSDVREWFINSLACGTTGNADLVAYFFLRAHALLNTHGTLGLIATNTVAQGDTREVGLDRLVERGFTITHAQQSRKWPAKSANLEYAAVWGTRVKVPEAIERFADGVPVRRISTLLEPAGRVAGLPQRLPENSGITFIGCFILGMGFVIEPEEAALWINADPRNAEVLFPYLNGEDLNTRPNCSARRWVVDFNEMTLREATTFDIPFQRVEAKVKPERATKDVDKYPRMVEEWWKFWNARPGLRKAIRDLDEVLAIALVSKTVMPVRVSAKQVFSHMLGVFASSSYAAQAALSSSLHQVWAITYASTMRSDIRYTPSDVFETFPLPPESASLDRVGRMLDEERRQIMLRRGLGLTKLYNLVNDPDMSNADRDVARMREIHVELDEAVAAAYEWQDVPLGHGFHTYRQMTRWTISPAARVELLDRLLEENHRRASSQVCNNHQS